MVALDHPLWAKSMILGASPSLNQGVASNLKQKYEPRYGK